MKCMICSSKALPGSKLCKPCRSALRRARDDTISELMPLPRRMDALAWQYSQGGSTRLQLMEIPAPPSEGQRIGPWRDLWLRAWDAAGALRTAGLALVTLAVGGLAFIGTQQMRFESDQNAARAALAAPTAEPQTRISPTSLVEAARESAPAFSETPIVETPVAAPPQPAAARPRRAAADRPRAPAARVTPTEDPIAAFAAEETPRPAVVAALSPPAVASPQLDRWQTLSAALSRCAAFDVWNRSICEQAARSRHCDGVWGQNGMCVAGVVNDHGQ